VPLIVTAVPGTAEEGLIVRAGLTVN